MPIPYKRHDMKKVAAYVDQAMASRTEEDCGREIEAGQRICDAERREWLSYYDDNGHLKPGSERDPKFVPNRTYSFLAMSHDERAAFIISEKKRMGML